MQKNDDFFKKIGYIGESFETKVRKPMKKFISVSEAGQMVKSGSTVMIGGFLRCGSPEKVIDEIIKNKSELKESIKLAVLQHHEKINGTGYPFGVDSSKICTFAKILSVLDIYDAEV